MSAADPGSLRELERGAAFDSILLSLAAKVGEIRMIDNVLLADGAPDAS